jgi:hypothetical protein
LIITETSNRENVITNLTAAYKAADTDITTKLDITKEALEIAINSEKTARETSILQIEESFKVADKAIEAAVNEVLDAVDSVTEKVQATQSKADTNGRDIESIKTDYLRFGLNDGIYLGSSDIELIISGGTADMDS